MKKYYISHMDNETKQKNIEFYKEIEDKGKFIKTDWRGDYLVGTFEYKGKIYELWDNMEYGIMSEIDEWEVKEYEQGNK